MTPHLTCKPIAHVRPTADIYIEHVSVHWTHKPPFLLGKLPADHVASNPDPGYIQKADHPDKNLALTLTIYVLGSFS